MKKEPRKNELAQAVTDGVKQATEVPSFTHEDFVNLFNIINTHRGIAGADVEHVVALKQKLALHAKATAPSGKD